MKPKRIARVLSTVIILVLFLSFLTIPSFAVLPPEVYERMVEESKVKVTATVESVKVLSHYRAVDEKKVTFKLIKSFGEVKPPGKFTGRCESVNRRWFEKGPGAGGTIYYYPKRGDKVYVTISSDGGQITSYTILTLELEKTLAEDFGKVKTKMGRAYISK
jgi:hypothetical protein